MAHPIAVLSTESVSGSDKTSALGVVAALCEVAEQLVSTPQNIAARARAFRAARAAGACLTSGELGFHHRLAHLLGGRPLGSMVKRV